MKKRLPDWFKQNLPDRKKVQELKELFQSASINTVCQEAHCPNLSQCWEKKVATFMILGHICTRNCRFCAVSSGVPSPVNPREPIEVAAAIKKLGLKYVVITSVTRDDLADQGARQFVLTINAIRKVSPSTAVEVLIPDLCYENDNLKQVIEARPEVIGHNIETTERIFGTVRPQADYHRSLAVLAAVKEMDPTCLVKSGFMVGLGETLPEIRYLMKDLRKVDCDILSIGQYLAPSSNGHVKESRFVNVEEFAVYEDYGRQLGFQYVLSGPKVRSSFLAEEGYRYVIANRQSGFEEGFRDSISVRPGV